ncbi:MAG: hypothetical protein Ct9H300mP13_3740 [Gammaproteobacteria bacterium]|nr:MAG: hypothetical protein Ct9H300mP13_3740 [Gammaproteobacteria bacterium]
MGLHHGDRFKTTKLDDEIAKFLSDLGQIGILQVGNDSPDEQERALFELQEYTLLGGPNGLRRIPFDWAN